MKTLIFVACLIVTVFGRPQAVEDKDAVVVAESILKNPDGSHTASFQTSNGIGIHQSINRQGVHKGSYEYIAPDGTPIKVTYEAGPNGFKAISDVLPVAPALPAHLRN